MNKLYMGIDIGSVTVKGVIIDKYGNIIASSYLYTEGNPVKSVKEVIKRMRKEIDLDKYEVVSVGVTGAIRKLIGIMLSATTIKNEITAHAVGTLKMYPNVKTIFEIGGEDSKIIIINNDDISDYAINTSCAAGSGAFIDAFARRLNIKTEDVSDVALSSKHRIDIDTRCMIFAETDLVHKIKNGYKKEDIMMGVCYGVAKNYLNNVARGKKIQSPIVFNGGVSKNTAVVLALKDMLGEDIIVNNNSHLMGAYGIAIMARNSKKEKVFDFNIDDYKIETKIANCSKCDTNCEIVTVYKNDTLVDYWGNKCKLTNEIKNV